jgi:hypothetical protein
LDQPVPKPLVAPAPAVAGRVVHVLGRGRHGEPDLVVRAARVVAAQEGLVEGRRREAGKALEQQENVKTPHSVAKAPSMRRTATPATWGVAMEVPEYREYTG